MDEIIEAVQGQLLYYFDKCDFREPAVEAGYQIVVRALFHFVFISSAFKTPLWAFCLIAWIFGYPLMYLTLPIYVLKFNLLTVFCYSLAHHILARFDIAGYKEYAKLCVVIYSMGCFNYFKASGDVLDYCLVLIILSLKFLNVASTVTNQCPTIEFFTYLYYPTWGTLKTFRKMRFHAPQTNTNWCFRWLCSVPSVIIYNIFASNILVYNYYQYYFNVIPVMRCIFQGFQYRCLYYYQAQLADIDMLALGAMEQDWEENTIFDFLKIEFSTLITNSVGYSNSLLANYNHINLAHEDEPRREQIVVYHAFAVFLVIICYHLNYGLLWAVIMITWAAQRMIIFALEYFVEICIGDCHLPVCVHDYGRRNPLAYWSYKSFYMLYTQFRMGLIIVSAEYIHAAVVYMLLFIALDSITLLFVIIVKRWQEPETGVFFGRTE